MIFRTRHFFIATLLSLAVHAPAWGCLIFDDNKTLLERFQSVSHEASDSFESPIDIVHRYYFMIDAAGQGLDEDRRPTLNMQAVLNMFHDDIIYERQWRRLYRGKEQLTEFYLYERDIVGYHFNIHIIGVSRIENWTYVHVDGEFSGKRVSTQQSVNTKFVDHFIFDKDNKIIRRISTIDQRI